MSRRVILLCVASCALLAGAVSVVLAQGVENPARGVPGWEYRVVMITDVIDVRSALKQKPAELAAQLEAKYNELGREGWEYCGDTNGAVVFKRPKR